VLLALHRDRAHEWRNGTGFGPTMHLLLRYTQALITQMAQTAIGNRHHSVDQQLCGWLLLSLDRLLPYVAK
jgi:hypothetical protein